MDRNPMLQGGQNPVPVLGVVAGKASLDWTKIDEFKRNADDPRTAPHCYPGGNQDINHDAMPRDSSFGLKNTRNAEIVDGEPNELGIVSVAGLCWSEYCSQRQMEDAYYWQGIVTTESRLTNPLDSTTGDPDHGYATIRVGTHTVPNNGPKTIYAGNLVAWQFPRAPFSPVDASGTPSELFAGGATINKLARQGTPPTQFRPELVPFDESDFAPQLNAAYIAATTESSDNPDGVSNFNYTKALANGERVWSGLQEEAIAYKYGLWGIALTLVETLIRNGQLTVGGVPGTGAATAHNDARQIAENIGLFSTTGDRRILHEGLADVFALHLSPIDDVRAETHTRFDEATGKPSNIRKVATETPVDGDTEAQYTSLRVHAIDLLLRGVTCSWYSKTSKIVGRAMNTSAPADDADILFGHFTL
jgi:hypothetical protein